MGCNDGRAAGVSRVARMGHTVTDDRAVECRVAGKRDRARVSSASVPCRAEASWGRGCTSPCRYSGNGR
eukprot:3932987-Rhodomonas_salina.1